MFKSKILDFNSDLTNIEDILTYLYNYLSN